MSPGADCGAGALDAGVAGACAGVSAVFVQAPASSKRESDASTVVGVVRILISPMMGLSNRKPCTIAKLKRLQWLDVMQVERHWPFDDEGCKIYFPEGLS